VSFSQDFTVAATGYQTYTCSVPAGKNYRIVSAQWRSVTTTYLQPETNVDTNEFQRGSDTQSFLYISSVIGIVLRCTLVMDRNGP
jgi:phage-related tail fiber protein